MRHLVIALLITLATTTTLSAQTAAERRAVAQFDAAVAAYAQVHRDLDRQSAPVPKSADALTAQRAIESRADAIRRARPEPRQGAIFTKELVPVLRKQIADALRANRMASSDLLVDEVNEGNEGTVLMRVNAPFPWQGAVAMPLCVNNVLPELPDELQYRFVDRNLVLVDVVASLIVDILPQALPATGR
jgi:hypothetical protein